MDDATPVSVQTAAPSIAGIDEETILNYFSALNAGDYAAVAQLFTEEGVLHAPFAETIEGQAAIERYLQQEAQGMQLCPRQGICTPLDSGETAYKVSGLVQTPFFGVNVSWCFVLNDESKICSVQVKLLAALEELLNMRSSADQQPVTTGESTASKSDRQSASE